MRQPLHASGHRWRLDAGLRHLWGPVLSLRRCDQLLFYDRGRLVFQGPVWRNLHSSTSSGGFHIMQRSVWCGCQRGGVHGLAHSRSGRPDIGYDPALSRHGSNFLFALTPVCLNSSWRRTGLKAAQLQWCRPSGARAPGLIYTGSLFLSRVKSVYPVSRYQ